MDTSKTQKNKSIKYKNHHKINMVIFLLNIFKITFSIIGIIIGAGFASRPRNLFFFLFLWDNGTMGNNNCINIFRNNYL